MNYDDKIWREAFELDDLFEINGDFLLAIAAAKKRI